MLARLCSAESFLVHRLLKAHAFIGQAAREKLPTLVENGLRFISIGRPPARERGEGRGLDEIPTLLADADTAAALQLRRVGRMPGDAGNALPALAQPLGHPAAGRTCGLVDDEGLQVADERLEGVVSS